MTWTPRGTLTEGTFVSRALNNERRIWIQPPVDAPESDAADFALFLDGEYYLTHIAAPSTLRELQAAGVLRPMWAVFVEAGRRTQRWPESFCNPAFAEFLSKELVPAMLAETGSTGSRLLCGVSLSGLSAAHAALASPGLFDRVLCHSGSFWWNDCAFAARVGDFPKSPTRFRITVGDAESETNVDHGFGLLQADSQITGCERARNALLSHEFDVSYNVYEGGHDMASWRRELAGDLRALFDAQP